tara:strand:+ start:48 stop:2210 length:2163 start_codon:yes stop_codon:yes gene_type:complete
MQRNSTVLTASENIDIGLNEGNAILVQLTGTGAPVATVDFQSTIDGITYTNTPYIQNRSLAAAPSVAQLSSITTVTEYVILPVLTQARIAVAWTSGTSLAVAWREILITSQEPNIPRGAAAEDAAASGNPVLTGGRVDSTDRTLDDGDVGAFSIDAAGRVKVVGAVASDAVAAGNPVQTGGVVDDTTPASAAEADARAFRATPEGNQIVEPYLDNVTHLIADDAAFTPATSPVAPIGMLADETSADSVDEGDIGAPRMTLDRQARVVAGLQDDSGNTTTRPKGDDQGVQYTRGIGEAPSQERNLALGIQKASVGTTATALTGLDFLVKEAHITSDQGNTDTHLRVGDAGAQELEVWKAASGVAPTPIGAGLLKDVYVITGTTAADDANVFARLTDRPDFRQLIEESVKASGGAYWPFEELSGTALTDNGEDQRDLLISGATVKQAGAFGFGVDFDGSNDTARQKSEATESGTVTGNEADGSAALDDDGNTFTSAIRDGKHWIKVTDNGGDILTGYIGTADPGGDDSEIEVYNDAARTTQNWIEGGSTAFDMADAPLTYHVIKELARASTALTVGCWVDVDAIGAAGFLIGAHDALGSSIQAGFSLTISATGAFRMSMPNGTSDVIATPTLLARTGKQYFVVGVYEASTRVTVYVNGVQEAENTSSVGAAGNEVRNPVELGVRRVLGTPSEFFNGRISHPFVIHAAKTDNWVRTAYEMSRR